MIEQRTEAWHSQRKHRVTGSQAGALLGLSPFVSQRQAIERLANPPTAEEREAEDNHIFAYGRTVEPHAIGMFEMETGCTVEEAPFVPHSNWLGASPDGYVLLNGSRVGILEVKCPWSLRNDAEPQFKSLLDQQHYYAQVQIELYCAEVDIAYFYQYANGKTKLEIVPRNQAWLDVNLPRLQAIWQTVFGDKDTAAHEEACKLTDLWFANKERIDKLTEENKTVLSEIIAIAGEQPGNIGNAYLQRTERNGSVSYAKIVNEHLPELSLEPYRGKPSVSWSLKAK